MCVKNADFLHIRALIDTKTLLQQFMKQQMKECFFFVVIWACYSCPLIHGRSPVLEPLFLDRDERHMTGLFLTWGIVVKGASPLCNRTVQYFNYVTQMFMCRETLNFDLYKLCIVAMVVSKQV